MVFRYHALLPPRKETPMASHRFTRIAVTQRKSAREPKNNQPVRLVFGDAFSPLVGMLRDLSATGARVSIAVPKNIPERFTLHFPDSSPRRCRIVWRSPKSIGIEFVSGERRLRKDRRTGIDTRSEEDKRLIGERRANRERRSVSDRRSTAATDASLLAGGRGEH